MKIKKLLVTAGHSNSDPGAVGNGTTEAKEAVDLRQIVITKVRQQLPELAVITDGDLRDNLNLNSAISLIKKHSPDLAIELHFNAGGASSTGVETIALPTAEKVKISQEISQSIAKVMGISVRGNKGFKTQEESHRGKLGYVNAGGLIIEVCFLSNKKEIDTYNAKEYLVAQAIVDVIKKYV